MKRKQSKTLIFALAQKRNPAGGFTLIELVAVLVILGIVSVIGSNFIVSAVDSYNDTERRAKMIASGRTAIEQITRQLRNAMPNSVRVSASGSCLEYLPVLAGANYTTAVADAENGAALTSSIATTSFTLATGTAQHVIIGAMSSDEVYTSAVPSARANIGTLGASPYTVIPLTPSHRFIRNSKSQRVFISDDPRRFCLSAGQLVQYSAYGLDTSALNDSAPGGTSLLISENVSTPGQAFTLSPGSEDRNTAINIALTFAERGDQVDLNGQVLVRNVP